jgi:eukaryotic-like serine/threonine-protein kinase
MQARSQRIYRFDKFQLDVLERQLSHDGQPVPLKGKSFELLLVLVEHSGQVLKKEELYQLVWPGQVVEESNLTVHMSAIRKALGERASRPHYITTISGHGYRFVADLLEPDDETNDLVVERHTVARILIEGEASLTDVPKQTRATWIPVGLHARPKFYLAIAVIIVASLALAAAFITGSRYLRRDERAAPVSPFQQMKMTRLTTEGKVLKAVISPDGIYFVYVLAETSGQSLWVKQMAGSRSVRIVPPGGFFYWGLTFSPDGNHVYCTLFDNNKGSWLMRVPALGGAVEKVDVETNTAISFSPDAEHYAFGQSYRAEGLTFVKIAAAGSERRVLGRREQPDYFLIFDAASVAWSPDGETVAVAAYNAEAGGDYMTVVGLGATDGREILLTTRRWASVTNVAWLPDGSGLLLTASDQLSMPKQLWLLSYPGGEASRITNDLDEYNSISVTADGRGVLAVQNNDISSVWTMEAKPGMSDARQIASEAGHHSAVGWTPDGRIVYRSYASGSPDLWVMEADGANPKQLTANARADEFRVSPDGRYIVFASDRTGKWHLWRVGVDGSDLQQLTDGEGELFPSFTPDGQWVIYQRGIGGMKATFWKIRVTGGEPLQLTDIDGVRPELSPDGNRLAYFFMDDAAGPTQWRLGIMPVRGGAAAQSFKLPDTVVQRIARWTPDGQGVIYISAVGGIANLWRQSLDGSPPAQLTNFDKETIDNFDWDSEGKRIVLTRRTQLSDVVLLRDFR